MSQNSSYTSPFTFERLEALEAAIAEGVRRVKYTDKEVEYRSIEEMMRVRDLMRQKLGLNKTCDDNKGLFGGTRIIAKHSKGLGDC